MELYSDSDRPSLEYSVEKRLKRHNDKLHVTWSKFVIDLDPNSKNYGKPVITKWGEPILGDVPSYYLWIKTEDYGYRFVADYVHFGHQAINRLESDMFRRMTHAQAMDRIRWHREAEKEKALADKSDMTYQKVSANKKRINDLLHEGKTGQRTAKITSYGGQGNRGSRDQVFQSDNKEAGWELPEQE